MRIQPFTIAIDDAALEDLTLRLARTRWPDAIAGMEWEDGTDRAFLQRLASYWQTGFDWRAQEARLNRLPQFTATIDGLDILTNISIFWFTQTIGSAMRFYREDRLTPTEFKPGERIVPPLGVTVMPKEKDIMPPRSWVERVFNVTHWTRMPHGGHFAAHEAPEALAEDIRAFFRPLRSRRDG